MSALPQPLGQPPHAIQPMQEADLDAVMEIERLSFRLPWSRQVFVEELQRTWAFLDVLRLTGEPAPARGQTPGAPAASPAGRAPTSTAENRVVGFCNYWRVADEVHLLKVATHPDARRLGLASLLLQHILGFARRQPCRLVTLEVRRSNEPAQRLYRRFGFKAVGLRPSYYADDNEDAVVMMLELPPP
jgi:ribosomal-protein-alanine N-acetyltransferase